MDNNIVTYPLISPMLSCRKNESRVTVIKRTWDPVDGSGNLVLVSSLERINDSQNLSGVAPGRCGIGQNETDSLLGVDDEDASNGEGDALAIHIGGVLVVKHVVGVGDLALLVSDDWELEVAAGDLVDVLDPSFVRVDRVCR